MMFKFKLINILRSFPRNILFGPLLLRCHICVFSEERVQEVNAGAKRSDVLHRTCVKKGDACQSVSRTIRTQQFIVITLLEDCIR